MMQDSSKPQTNADTATRQNEHQLSDSAVSHFREANVGEANELDVNIIPTDSSTDLSVAITDRLGAAIPADTLLLNDLLVDVDLKWQIHNCKLSEQRLTQDAPLAFLYHYDSLADEIKAATPLTPDLLKRFNEPMQADTAAELLGLPVHSIAIPWQVKVVGTLVMFSEPLQLAVRLRFTNSAKALEPIYTTDKAQALTQAMQSWHFFGDVFILNRGNQSIAIAPSDASGAQQALMLLQPSTDYQFVPPPYSVALLTELDAHKAELPQLDAAVQQRIS